MSLSRTAIVKSNRVALERAMHTFEDDPDDEGVVSIIRKHRVVFTCRAVEADSATLASAINYMNDGQVEDALRTFIVEAIVGSSIAIKIDDRAVQWTCEAYTPARK